MAVLSREQRFVIDAVLVDWRHQYQNGQCFIDTKRLIAGSVPTWSDWSGSRWVRSHSRLYRDQLFRSLHYVHISIFLHLALPPFWDTKQEHEREAVRQYGHWISETEWSPPQIINGTSAWIERL